VKRLAILVLALGAGWATTAAHAQDAWPSRNITFIVPYGAGGYTDLIGRMTASYVEKELGKSVVVENRAGGGGIVGTGAVARSAPDGYTFCVCSVGAISVVPFAQGQKVGYDPVQDLMPVAILSTISQAVVVKKALPINSMADLVAHAKANPGKLNYGSSGLAGLTHYAVELFQSRTGTKMNHIPYKTGAQGVLAIVSGEVDFAFANMTDALPQIEAGTVRALAVTSRDRSPYFPNLPSVHESISPGFVVETWNGLMAPAKTPEPIIRRMSQVLMKMADDPEVKKAMVKAGANTFKTTPEQYTKQIQDEIAQWKPLLAEIASTKQ
jgi:tripartite-type tricarboxylate transporter receptor subunit TctC